MSAFVAVVGSANLDVVLSVDRRPAAGETVLGTAYAETAGGKGANQAVAAARVAPTAFIGRVGRDPGAAAIAETLERAGVDLEHLQRGQELTGRAYITLTPDGENDIIVMPLANWALGAAEVTAALDELEPAVVLTQLESPEAVTGAVAAWCIAHSIRLIVNASPVRTLPAEILEAADPLIVNEVEARVILGSADAVTHADLAAALAVSSRSVVLTAGKDGAFVASGSSVEHVAGKAVKVVDTTGAGDAFAGTLAAHLARNESLRAAVEEANRQAAWTVERSRDQRG